MLALYARRYPTIEIKLYLGDDFLSPPKWIYIAKIGLNRTKNGGKEGNRQQAKGGGFFLNPECPKAIFDCYSIGIKNKKGSDNPPILAWEKVWKHKTLILDRPDQYDNEDEKLLTQTALEQLRFNRDLVVLSM